ncbi:MAG: glycerophosphodiester phosphodiesterase family protein [Bacteroidota bacterium]
MSHFPKWLMLVLCWTLLAACKQDSATQTEEKTMEIPEDFDVQGHRGARGLLPENTIPSFEKALDLGANTLELDLVVSADDQVIVSHEPWFSPEFCSLPSGESLPEDSKEIHNIYQLNYEAIKAYDCGSKGHPKFPEQVALKAHKPSLKDMLVHIENYAEEKGYPAPRYNMEIKARPNWDDQFTPAPERFVDLVLAVVRQMEVGERSVIQSFDPRILEAIYQKAPNQVTAYLVSNNKTVQQNLELLSYVPKIYSPNYLFLTPRDMQDARAQNMKVIPWTVNDVEDMKKQILLGVDGIITDYPDRLLQLIAENK